MDYPLQLGCNQIKKEKGNEMTNQNNQNRAVVGVTEANGRFNVWVSTNVNGVWNTNNTSQRFTTEEEARFEAVNQANDFRNRNWNVRVEA